MKTNLEKLLNQNPNSNSKLIVAYYNFLNSIEEFNNLEILTLIISESFLSNNTVVITDSIILELDKTFEDITVLNKFSISELSHVYYKEATFFSKEKLIMKLSNSMELEISLFTKEQLRDLERKLLLLKGASLQIQSQTENKQTNANVVNQEFKNSDDDEITQKLLKIKSIFERGLISEKEYENKKAEILSNL